MWDVGSCIPGKLTYMDYSPDTIRIDYYVVMIIWSGKEIVISKVVISKALVKQCMMSKIK